jgi:phosphohistidine phosphatase
MKLYLARHAAAIDSAPDSQRALSAHGQQQALQLAKHLAVQCGDQALDIFYSGLLRAQQTAAVVAQHITVGKFATISGLMPEDPIALMLLNTETWRQNTLLVGHLPYLYELLWALVRSGPSRLQAEALMFSPATVVCLAQSGDQWQIQWKFSPV